MPFENVPDVPLLNIKAVSQATGIDPVTLRAWERRYGVPTPQRAERGYRLYSERDVAVLLWLKARTEAGVTIRRAIEMLRSHNPQTYGEAALQRPHVQPTASLISLAELRATAMEASSQFNTQQAQQAIKQAFSLYPMEVVCYDLVLPLLQELGEGWMSGKISLQVEHFASNIVRQQLLAYGATLPPPWREGKIVAGCAPGDWHEIGIMILSLFLRRKGCEVIYLGQAVGTDRLAEALEAIQPRLVVLSAGQIETACHLIDAAAAVEEAGGSHIIFAFGGTIFETAPELTNRLPGVFIGLTLDNAQELIENLLTDPLNAHPNAWTPLPPEAVHAHSAVKAAALTLTDGLTGLLLDAAPALRPEQAINAARQQMTNLLAALRLDYPEILSSQANLNRGAFQANKVPVESLHQLFAAYVDQAALAKLSPYLMRL